jgi:prophage regulatory protein
MPNKLPFDELPDDALVDRVVVLPFTGLKSWAPFYERLKTGRIPAPIKLSRRCSRWRVRDVRHYISDPLGWERGEYAAPEREAA